ncbi:MAG: biotin--[acetyl-CoA-carboxylase] ligase [Oscillospiraceae bacterium]|nr:biotin--[acetyl-CoA-carboxylase] ligase [Oscillospiraceae bacterium]
MSDSSNVLDAKHIHSYLHDSLKDKLSCNIYIYDCLESTNLTAKKMALSGATHGTVIIADRQTAGRGQHGKSFHSPQGHGIYISFILDVNQLKLTSHNTITTAAAVSVCEAIESVCGKSPKVKKVNDIFLDDRKVCGILTESVIGAQSHEIKHLILGIGINFTTPPEAFPKDLQNIAGAIFPDCSPPITRNHLTAEIINRILSVEASGKTFLVF